MVLLTAPPAASLVLMKHHEVFSSSFFMRWEMAGAIFWVLWNYLIILEKRKITMVIVLFFMT